MIETIKKEINNLLKDDEWYKAYNKETTIKAILVDINNIFEKFTGKETTFILENETFNSFELVYKLADKGIINLEHDNMEDKGIEVIL